MRIVTMSRQIGSYGDVIAAIVAKQLGLELMTRDKVHELAQTCDPAYSDACNLYETEHGPGFFERIFLDKPSYRSLFDSLTLEEASRGDVVIMGRGAEVALADLPGVVRVRTVAPMAIRVQRIMERYGQSEKDAEHMTRKFDRDRDNLFRAIYARDPDDWSLCDLIINTAHFTPEAAATVVIQAVDKARRGPQKEDLRKKLKDAAVAKRIEALIRSKLPSGVGHNMEVSSESEGVVKITGVIREKKDKDRAEKMASEYPGISKVINELKVTDLYFGYS